MAQDNFDRLLALLCSVLDAYSAVLFFPTGQGEAQENREHFVAASFSLGNKVDLDTNVVEGRGIVGWILRHKEPLLVANFDKHKNFLGYYKDGEESTIKAFMGCPLRDGMGALCLDSKRQYSFSEKDQKILYLFADLVSQMQRDYLEQNRWALGVKYFSALKAVYFLRQSHKRWTEFLRHFFDLILSVTGFSYVTLCTLDPGYETFSVEAESSPLLWKNGECPPSMPLTSGLVGWVFRNGCEVVTGGEDGAPDTQLVGKPYDTTSFQSMMAMPLVIQKRTRGVLCLCSEVPQKNCDLTKDFVRMGTDHVALFLENLYVKSRLRDMYRQTQQNSQKDLEGND